MIRIIFILLFCSVIFNFSYADALIEGKIDTSMKTLHEDVKNATKKLHEIYQNIEHEKLPCVQKINSLEQAVIRLRKTYEEENRNSSYLENERNELAEKNEMLENEFRLSEGILLEYRKDLIKVMSFQEELHLNKTFKIIDAFFESESKDAFSNVFHELIKLLRLRLKSCSGLKIFEGKCMDFKGNVLTGKYFLTGPLSYFLSDDQKYSGITDTIPDKSYPSIIQSVNAKKIHSLSNFKETKIPVLLKQNNSSRLTSKGLLKHIRSGGILMIPILGLGVICIMVSLWKLIVFSQLKITMDPFLPSIISMIQEGKQEEAKSFIQKLGSPLGPVLKEGIENYQSSRGELEEVMHEKILLQIPFFEKGLQILSVSAAASPLLGLLGTVTGMIHTFNLVTIYGSGKASLLSEGISEALITTEFGLLVAIPALLVHAYFARKVKLLIHTLDHSAIAFINGVKIKTGL